MDMFMKMMRSIVSLALIAGIGYSQCTGGLFAIPMAFASDLNFQQKIVEEDSPLMSKDVTACFDDLMSHAQEDDHTEGDHIEQGHESGCGDGAPCVRQTQQVLTMDRSGSASNERNILFANTITDAFLSIFTNDKPSFHARAGPLYEHSSLLAHTLIKRE